MLEFKIDELDSDEEVWMLREALFIYRDSLKSEYKLVTYEDTKNKIKDNIKIITGWIDELSDCLQILENKKQAASKLKP